MMKLINTSTPPPPPAARGSASSRIQGRTALPASATRRASGACAPSPARRGARLRTYALTSPSAALPAFSPPPGGALAAPAGGDLMGLMALGAVAGATAAQLCAPPAFRRAAGPAGAVAGAAAGALLPGALDHLPTSLALVGIAAGTAELAARPLLARVLGPQRAGELARPLALALALGGLAAAQVAR